MQERKLNLVRELDVLGVHAEGEIGRVILSGAPGIPGRTMVERMDYINNEDDEILRLALYEPRGASQMTINLLVPPTSRHADTGFIPMQADGAHAMSGSNAMCVATALLETGTLTMREPESVVVLDTPAGLVRARANCRNGKVERVEIAMPACFVEHLDHPVEVEGVGTLKVDVAFGGCYFTLIDAASLGFEIARHEARDLVDMGNRIKRAAGEQIAVNHPTVPAFDRIEYPMFVAGQGQSIVNATVIHPGRLDRSPCGTGTVARMAVMHARGEIGINEVVSSRSVIGSEFRTRIDRLGRCGHRRAVQPALSGRAWIYGRMTLGAHPMDPYPLGFTLPDTW